MTNFFNINIFHGNLEILRKRIGCNKKEFSKLLGVNNAYRKDFNSIGPHILSGIQRLFPSIDEKWLLTKHENEQYDSKIQKTAEGSGLFGKTTFHEVDNKKLTVVQYVPEGKEYDNPDEKTATPIEVLTVDELALIRILRRCGPEYKRMVYYSASKRAENVTDEKKLETKEKLKYREDLETLSTAAIK